MRALPLVLGLSMMASTSLAQDMTGIDWQLLAIDGVYFDAEATLRIEAGGAISGRAPCNGWSTMNEAELPSLALRGIRATKRACDKLDAERAFFDALAEMTSLEMAGRRNLVLTGPDGRTMEFVLDRMNSLTRCTTCPPIE
jgi:heat shock protein HslJ